MAAALLKPWMEEAKALGIDVKTLARAHADELAAQDPRYIKIRKTEFDPIKLSPKFLKEIGRGAEKVIETGAEILIRIPEPNWETRQEARREWEIKLGLRKEEVPGSNVTIILKPDQITKPKSSGRHEAK